MKKIKLSTAVALIILSVVTTVNVMLITTVEMLNTGEGDYQQQQKRVGKLYEVMDLIDAYYVGEITEQNAQDFAAAGFVAGIGDKWSYYLTSEQYKEYKSSQDQDLVGIGVEAMLDDTTKAMILTKVYKGSPAETAGLQVDDYIIFVDGTQVSQIGFEQAAEMIRGDSGKKVEITYVREDVKHVVNITREHMMVPSVDFEMIDGNIGYIEISSFESNTFLEFETAVQTLEDQGAVAYVFDVRNNPGGFLDQLVDCLDMLLPQGDIISTVNKAGDKEVHKSDADSLDKPMVVLANEQSVSAAEFFAAAIQEYGLGQVVGTNTLGKGYSQQTVELSDGSAVVLSTNKYYTPDGRNLAGIGIEPNVVVTLSAEESDTYYLLTPQNDPQILKGIELLKAEIDTAE